MGILRAKVPLLSRSKRSGVFLIVAVLGLTIVGCKEDDWVCAPLPSRGVDLTVVDAITGNSLGTLAVVTVTGLSPRAPSTSGPPEQVGSLTAIAGTYELRIIATGYVSRTDTVAVASRFVRECEETVTVARTVRLTPQR